MLALADRKLPGNEQHAALRREARVRLLGLLVRQGRGRMDAQIRQLRDDARAHPDDLEVALFLAEAQQRTGDSAGAITTLKDLLRPGGRRRAAAAVRATSPSRPGSRSSTCSSARGQLDEAVARLDEIARLAPARAREAHLQIADIALARYDVTRALSHATAAAAQRRSQTLARVGDLQARAGADDLAIATYRAAVARDTNPAATLSLARLLVRRGDEQEAADALGRTAAASRDDDAITEAGRLAIELADLRGRLPELESELAEAQAAGQDTPARRKLLAALLKRLLPPMYRDPAADDARNAIGRARPAPAAGDHHRSRTDARPRGHRSDRHARATATPRRRWSGSRSAKRSRQSRAARRCVRSAHLGRRGGIDAQLAALVALARLGDPRGRPAFARFMAPNNDRRFRAIADLGPRPPVRRGWRHRS